MGERRLPFKMAFGHPVGPVRRWFAWWPVRTFDGVLVWLRPTLRVRHQPHDYLPGPGNQFWVYLLPRDMPDA